MEGPSYYGCSRSVTTPPSRSAGVFVRRRTLGKARVPENSLALAFLPVLLELRRLSLLAALLSVLPYLNSLQGGYVYDDKYAVVSNSDVSGAHSWESLRQLWGQPAAIWATCTPGVDVFGMCLI